MGSGAASLAVTEGPRCCRVATGRDRAQSRQPRRWARVRRRSTAHMALCTRHPASRGAQPAGAGAGGVRDRRRVRVQPASSQREQRRRRAYAVGTRDIPSARRKGSDEPTTVGARRMPVPATAARPIPRPASLGARRIQCRPNDRGTDGNRPTLRRDAPLCQRSPATLRPLSGHAQLSSASDAGAGCRYREA